MAVRCAVVIGSVLHAALTTLNPSFVLWTGA